MSDQDTVDETELAVQRLQAERKRHGVYLLILAVVMMMLIGAGIYLWQAWQDTDSKLGDSQHKTTAQDTRIDKLETALEAQVRQFNRCKNKPVGTPGCTVAVSPQPGGIPGPEGAAGARGPSCVEELGYNLCRGTQGIQGIQGRTGQQGAPGIGIQGDQGAQGVAGKSCVEEFGLAQCQGPKGDKGDTGVVNADDQCASAGAGDFVKDVGISYSGQTVTLNCSYGASASQTIQCTYDTFWVISADWDGKPGSFPGLRQVTVVTDCVLV